RPAGGPTRALPPVSPPPGCLAEPVQCFADPASRQQRLQRTQVALLGGGDEEALSQLFSRCCRAARGSAVVPLVGQTADETAGWCRPLYWSPGDSLDTHSSTI